jgi:hypothetical protein
LNKRLQRSNIKIMNGNKPALTQINGQGHLSCS